MRALFLLAVAILSGCASSLATMQTAKPIEPLHVQASTDTGFYVPLGPTASLIGQAIAQADKLRKVVQEQQPYTLTEDEQQELLTAGIALAVMPPSQVYDFSIRTGVVRNLDVGLRYSVSAVRADAKYRIFHGGDSETPPAAPEPTVQRGKWKPNISTAKSFDLALGIGLSRYLFENPAIEVLGFVKMNDFERWDLEVPLYASFELGEIFKLYAAPKYIYSRTELDQELIDAAMGASFLTGLNLSLPAEVHSHFAGASLGAAVGYRWVHLWLELTGGYTFSNPKVMGKVRPLGGVTLQPGAGISLSF